MHCASGQRQRRSPLPRRFCHQSERCGRSRQRGHTSLGTARRAHAFPPAQRCRGSAGHAPPSGSSPRGQRCAHDAPDRSCPRQASPPTSVRRRRRAA
eukprot:2451748-Pleurochrysis_carterae.AAC.4